MDFSKENVKMVSSTTLKIYEISHIIRGVKPFIHSKGGVTMKTYLSLREAAERWGVSERRINQYCAEGRIAGAQRFGTSWAIPDYAEKPGDPRKNKNSITFPKSSKKTELYLSFMPLMSTAFEIGKCKETIKNIINCSTGRICILCVSFRFWDS